MIHFHSHQNFTFFYTLIILNECSIADCSNHKEICLGFPTRIDTNWAVKEPQRITDSRTLFNRFLSISLDILVVNRFEYTDYVRHNFDVRCFLVALICATVVIRYGQSNSIKFSHETKSSRHSLVISFGAQINIYYLCYCT